MSIVDPAAPPRAPAWARIATLAELGGPGPFALNAGGLDLVVVRTGAGFKAFDGVCPHQGALLGEGELDGDVLVCRNHRWRFDSATGRRLGGPQCLVECPVEVRGDELWVETGPLARARATAGPAAQRTIDDLPGPRGLPIIGNLHQLDINRWHEILERWATEYGQLFTYRMGPNRIVVVTQPELMEKVLRDRPDTYRRSSNVQPVFREMGVDGVFSAEGAVWRTQRRLAMHALSHRHLRGFYPTLSTVTRRLRHRWTRKADAGAALDIVEEMKRFTVDVTTALAFGRDVNTIAKDDDVIQRQLEHVFPALNRRLFALFPTWRWLRMPADRRLDRALAELRVWLGEIIAETRARLEAEPERAEHPENFLESMLAARDEEGRPFSDDVIFGNAMTMLLAGEDTTAFTLAWAVHHLCDSPDAVARIRAEAAPILAGDAAPPDIEAAGRLTYAGAAANEAMRLRPVAPILLLEANRDVVVGDVALPAGTWVALLTRTPATDGANFGESDAFLPERWLSEPPAGMAHNASAHIPFGSGPRICPGRSLALVEMKIVLAMLYDAFDVERVGDGARVREQFAFTMSPIGLRVKLRRRQV